MVVVPRIFTRVPSRKATFLPIFLVIFFKFASPPGEGGHGGEQTARWKNLDWFQEVAGVTSNLPVVVTFSSEKNVHIDYALTRDLLNQRVLLISL